MQSPAIPPASPAWPADCTVCIAQAATWPVPRCAPPLPSPPPPQRIPSAFAAGRSWQGTARVRMAPLQLRPRLRRLRSPRPSRQLSSASPIRSAPRSRQRPRPSPSPSRSRRRRRRRWRWQSRRPPQRYRAIDTTARTHARRRAQAQLATHAVAHMRTRHSLAHSRLRWAQAAWPELGKVKCQKTLVSPHLQTHTHKRARTNTLARNCRLAIHGTGPAASGVLLCWGTMLRGGDSMVRS